MLDEQEILNQYFEERLHPNEKTKKLKEMREDFHGKKQWELKRYELEKMSNIIKSHTTKIKKKLRDIFSKKYRPDIFNKTLEEIRSFKRDDFIMIKPMVYKNTGLDEAHNKELPWRHITEIDPVKYPNWTVEGKINNFRGYFRNWR